MTLLEAAAIIFIARRQFFTIQALVNIIEALDGQTRLNASVRNALAKSSWCHARVVDILREMNRQRKANNRGP